jgi:hypothetical protein
VADPDGDHKFNPLVLLKLKFKPALKGSFAGLPRSLPGPRLPTWAMQQVVSLSGVLKTC